MIIIWRGLIIMVNVFSCIFTYKLSHHFSIYTYLFQSSSHQIYLSSQSIYLSWSWSQKTKACLIWTSCGKTIGGIPPIPITRVKPKETRRQKSRRTKRMKVWRWRRRRSEIMGSWRRLRVQKEKVKRVVNLIMKCIYGLREKGERKWKTCSLLFMLCFPIFLLR